MSHIYTSLIAHHYIQCVRDVDIYLSSHPIYYTHVYMIFTHVSISRITSNIAYISLIASNTCKYVSYIDLSNRIQYIQFGALFTHVCISLVTYIITNVAHYIYTCMYISNISNQHSIYLYVRIQHIIHKYLCLMYTHL